MIMSEIVSGIWHDYRIHFLKSSSDVILKKKVEMAFACTTPVKPTMELLKLSGVQCSDGVRHAGWFADSL